MDNWSWFVGLYEGEGSVSFENRQFRITIGMTDEDVIRLVQQRIGGIVNGPYIYDNKRKKPAFVWSISCTAALPIAERLLPDLGERRSVQMQQKMNEYLAYLQDVQDRSAMCKNGLHPMDGPGRCEPCYKEHYRRANAKVKARKADMRG